VSDEALIELAEAAGLQPRWRDAAGAQKTVAPDALRSLLSALSLPAATPAQVRDSQARLASRREAMAPLLTADAGGEIELVRPGLGPLARLTLETGEAIDIALTPTAHGARLRAPDRPGYHRLVVGDREATLAVAPAKTQPLADRAAGGRAWGAAVQVYSLAGAGDFGDFGDLAAFAEAIGARGAQALAVSPVHALFAADPSRYSPYAPSSRLFLNSLYADPAMIPGDAGPRAASPAAGALIDWAAAAPAKLTRLREAFKRLIDQGGPALEAFHTFRREGRRDLERHARFEALHAAFFAQAGARGWHDWPRPFHDPDGMAVSDFARAHTDEVTFYAFLQWMADIGLARAQDAARASGMGIGLIADLAVGLDAGGSQAWSRPDDLLRGVNVGAPPDLFQPRGQDWGVAALSPDSLRRSGYDAFLRTLRRALRHAGGVRIDHAMGLGRLWLTPHGASPSEGVYLTYPLKDLLRLVALEAHRAEALVIGEDLGTVPAGFREAMHDQGMLGMSVLWFERGADGAFVAPDAWSPKAAALTTTHDLPTVAGWWSGRDIDWLARLGQASVDEVTQARAARQADRARLWDACVAAGVASQGPPPQTPAPAVDAGIAYVAASACPLAIVPIEDLVGLEEQPNLPGTIDEHPNWRRRLPARADELMQSRAVAARIATLSKARPAEVSLA
jgi:4-alpha-glucanotransferase